MDPCLCMEVSDSEEMGLRNNRRFLGAWIHPVHTGIHAHTCLGEREDKYTAYKEQYADHSPFSRQY